MFRQTVLTIAENLEGIEWEGGWPADDEVSIDTCSKFKWSVMRLPFWEVFCSPRHGYKPSNHTFLKVLLPLTPVAWFLPRRNPVEVLLRWLPWYPHKGRQLVEVPSSKISIQEERFHMVRTVHPQSCWFDLLDPCGFSPIITHRSLLVDKDDHIYSQPTTPRGPDQQPRSIGDRPPPNPRPKPRPIQQHPQEPESGKHLRLCEQNNVHRNIPDHFSDGPNHWNYQCPYR